MPKQGNNTTSGTTNLIGKKGTTARKIKNTSGLGSFANPTKSWNNKSMFLK
jgi:hypothetical protein